MSFGPGRVVRPDPLESAVEGERLARNWRAVTSRVMIELEMQLKPGADPTRARQDVDLLHGQIGNLHGTAEQTTRGLVDWAQQAEVVLGNYFVHVDLDRLYTQRFWRISVGDIELLPYMVSREQTVQRAWLETVRAELDDLINAFGGIDAAIAVPDTNALLHYRLFSEIPWPDVLGRKPVRLAVPIAVIDELDRKKASRNRALAERARTVIKHLRAGSGQRVREDVDLVTVGSVEIGAGRRPASSLHVDVEILDTCEALTAYAAHGAVYLVSGDYGMELRAAKRAISFVRLDDRYIQPLATGG